MDGNFDVLFHRIVRFVFPSAWMLTGILNDPDEKEVSCFFFTSPLHTSIF